MGWIMPLVGSGISALSEHQQGVEAQRVANENAAMIESDTTTRAAKLRRLGEQQRGEARAALAAAGVDPNSGTSTLIDQRIQSDAQSDIGSTIISGYSQANAVRRGGQIAKQAGNINAVGTVVNAVGSNAGQSALASVGARFSKWKTSGSSASAGYGVQ